MKKLYETPEFEIDKFKLGDIATEEVSGLNPSEEVTDDFDF